MDFGPLRHVLAACEEIGASNATAVVRIASLTMSTSLLEIRKKRSCLLSRLKYCGYTSSPVDFTEHGPLRRP